jgi:hypothetical protein
MFANIVPHLTVSSLIGIRPSCNARCMDLFDRDKCDVIFNGSFVLHGYRDVATDLWTLLINRCSKMRTTLLQLAPVLDCALHFTPDLHPGINLASFKHSVRTRANGVKFAHQSSCNPKISTLLKAVRKGFLKGCPNSTKKLILKYLNPSPVTAKGHMKRPCHGIKSTQPKTAVPRNSRDTPPIAQAPPANMKAKHGPAFFPQGVHPILITDNCNESIDSIFCFGTFAKHHSGVMYNNLTGNFPFMSLDKSVCFLVMYHYETNANLGKPIAGLDDVSIFNAYKLNFSELTQKGTNQD